MLTLRFLQTQVQRISQTQSMECTVCRANMKPAVLNNAQRRAEHRFLCFELGYCPSCRTPISPNVASRRARVWKRWEAFLARGIVGQAASGSI